MFHLPSFPLFGMESFLLLLSFSIIIPLEIVKVLFWEGLKSGISLKALIFFMFFMEADADLVFQSEINCYCKWFVLCCAHSCQGRQESVRPRVPRLTTTIVLCICSAFRECLHWGLTMVLDALPSQGTSVRTALQLSHFQLFPPGYRLTFSATSVGRAAVKPVGSWHGALILWLVVRKLLLWHCDVSGAYKWVPAILLH